MTTSNAATRFTVVVLDDFRDRNSGIRTAATKENASEDRAKLTWHDLIRQRLQTLLDLPKGWDGYGAPPLSTHIAFFTQQILCEMWRPGLGVPDITPMSDGSLMLEWFAKERELTIEITEPYKLTYQMIRPTGEDEGNIGREIEPLRGLAAELAEIDLKRANG